VVLHSHHHLVLHRQPRRFPHHRADADADRVCRRSFQTDGHLLRHAERRLHQRFLPGISDLFEQYTCTVVALIFSLMHCLYSNDSVRPTRYRRICAVARSVDGGAKVFALMIDSTALYVGNHIDSQNSCLRRSTAGLTFLAHDSIIAYMLSALYAIACPSVYLSHGWISENG